MAAHPPFGVREILLLRTKLYMPPARSEWVSRPHLIKRLDAGLHHKLTLISAPAGFGKTTLLSEWVAHCGHPETQVRVAWLSLDEGDNDLTRFLIYVVAALQTVECSLEQEILPALQSTEQVNIEAVLTMLLNDITNYSHQLVLILDDYHIIESHAVDKALAFLLDHLPPQMHLFIASRADPTLPLSRLRAREQLTELRAADLRFTTDEVTTFLRQGFDLPISSGEIRTLETRTEGWITGLQLAAVAMRGLKQQEQIAHFVRYFGGSHRYIIDYLIDEVLDGQSSHTQTFLLQTSILKRLSASLCNAVTERENSQMTLEIFETANLFLIPLDNERHWYRYHHLFADLLMHCLSRTSPDLIATLHLRASVWYEKQGFIDDAFYHAQTAGDTIWATTIVEKHWQDLIHRGELTKLKRWLDSLDAKHIKKSAPLSMAYCWFYHLTNANDRLPIQIRQTRDALKESKTTQDNTLPDKLAVIPSLIETMESVVASTNGLASKAKMHAQEAIALIPSDADPMTRGLLYGAAGYRLARAHQKLGEYDQASVVLLTILDMLKFSQNALGVANTVWLLAALYRESGKIQAAITLCEDTLDYGRNQHWETTSSSGMINLVLANLQADAGDFEAAKKNLEIGQPLVESLLSPPVFDLAARIKEKLRHSIPQSQQPLVEPLSERELEILSLIAQGLSNRDICERLFLALSTVKGHNRNIYGKLGVQRRTEAIARAQELGLL